MAITHPVPFRCVVIGEGALPIQCAEIVIDAGHTLCGVISPDAQLRAWAEAHAVPFCHPTEDMSDFVRRMSIDYLFSIVNYTVLPAELLTMPRRAAINYHDAPLPRYAGLYATSWAILAGETQHAISWHLMTSHIDAGAILLQHALEIAPNDTAGSLNVKCYDAAVRTFPHLVHLLANGQATPRPQDLTRRTYRGRYARPPAACVLDWNQPAHQLIALVRALQFGHTLNDLGHPKLLLPGAAYIVADLDVLPTHTDAPPGTLVAVQAEQLVVATGSTDVAITHLQHMTGAPGTLSTIIQRHGLHAGMALPVLDTDTGESLSAWHRTVCRHEPFWRQRLADLHPLTLSALRPATLPDQPDTHQRLALDLPPALVETGQAAAVVRAAFAVYLARVTVSYHFDLGMRPPHMPHDQGELASLFATIVPLRVTLEPDQPFEQIVAALDAAWAEAVRRYTFPRDIVARYPDLWRQPALQQGLHLPICLCDGGPEGEAHLPADYALALVWEDAGRAWWLYDPAVVSPELAAAMGQQFCTLLAHACAEPQQPISHLALLDAAMYQRMVVEWNATAVPYPTDQCVHHLIAAQTARTPDAVAVVYEDEALTYAELQARTNQLAHHLIGLGVGPEVLVGICVERSLEMIVGLLGILKAGGAYVPLDPGYPAERLAFMLDDAQTPVLLTQEHLRDTLPDHTAHVICLDRDWPTIAEQPTTQPISNVQPDHLAYVIYTSGSTGRPKGVQIAHRAIVNRLLWMQDAYQLTPADRVLQKTPFSFDVSVWEFFWPLLTGACLVVARPEGHKDSHYLAEIIQQAHITTLHFVPSMLQVFLVEAGGAPCGSLRHVFCSGEALPYDLQTRFFAHLPQVALHNLYGPTEAAVDVSFWPCHPNSPGPVVPIGYPVANTQLYVLDSHMQPVPIGVPGDLYIGGVQLARGYLNRPDLTAERFIANPIGAGRLYRTGDLARYRPDGAIEFLGRADFQVKLRGFRIELGEIEAVLSQPPNVQQAVIIARDDGTGTRLIAYVVGNDLDPAALRAHLTARLPDYMVPAAFVVLAALPLTPNGKVDRKALPAPDAESVVRETYTPPRTATEQTLVDIWQAVLGLEQVGIHDNFIGLGGDSILAIQVVSRARAVGLPLAVRDLLQNQTIATLTAVVPTSPDAPTSEAAPGPVPLTPIQHWFLTPDPPEPHHFNQAMALDLVADVDIPRLHQALQHLAVQHAALRLRFTRTASGWQQTLAAEPAAIRLDVHDLTLLPTEEHQVQIASTAAAAQTSLDLTQGPLLGAVLWQRGPTTPARLLLVLHHLVVDWVSWAVLLDDLATIYQQPDVGKSVALPAPTTPFPTWARWLAAHGPQVVADERAFWHTHAQTTVPPLPRDVPEGANTVALTEHVTRRLSAATTQALLTTGHAAYHTRINDLLLTALALALADWTGAPQVRIDLEGHGREDLDPTLDLSRTLGWFTSLFPVVLDIVPDDLAASLIAVKETLRAIPRHGIGYGILRSLADDPVLAAAPAAEVSFNYLGQSDHLALTPPFLGMDGAGAFGLFRSPQQQRAHLLEIDGMVVNGQAQFTFSFSRAIHDPPRIAQVAAHFVTALERLVAHCQTSEGAYTPGDFPLAGLDQPALDRVVAAVRHQQPAVGPPRSEAIQSLAPLTPTQQGMLATTLADPTAGYQIEQLTWTWPSTINLEAYVQAWQDVIARHSGLRVLLVTNAATSYQAIVAPVNVPVSHHDWRGLDSAEQQARLETFLADDRRQGIDVRQAPLLRLAVIQLDEQRVQVVWTHHHLLLDGWSLPLLQHDLDQCYAARVAGQKPSMPPAPVYETYLAWLAQQDRAAAEQFWRTYLVGVTRPTPLTPQRDLSRPATYGRHTTWLAAATHEHLQIAARQWHVPLNTLVQAAWALVLHQVSGDNAVVFGATMAGRPPEVAGIAEMIGLFISTVPVRVSIVDTQPVGQWLHGLHTTMSTQQPYSYCTSGEIQQWSGLSGGLPLHESLLVVENYPTIDAVPGSLSAQMGEVRSEGAQTHYPLTLLVLPETELGLHAVYDERHFAPQHITGLLEQFGQVLTQMATAGAAATVGDVLAQTIWADGWSGVSPTPAAGGQATYTVPRTATEQTLADIWQAVLGVEHVGIHDNFFGLGGHSLLAVRLLTAIEQAIGQALPLASLFQHPTIAKLAELLDGAAAPLAVRSLVPIQPTGTRPPLFLVHPVGGHVLCYEPVARWVATDQPVYGLQAVGLADERPPLDTIEAMATHYIAELRTVQPHGPYVLGGWSLGGIVAFEMAHQLQTQGETVARLILIDTFRPTPVVAAVDDEATLLRRFLADVQGQREAELLRDNGHDLPIDSATTLAELLAHPDVASLLPPGIPPAHLHSWWQVFCANMHALHRYDPAPYAGPVTLVYATDQEDDAAATWQGFAPQMECVPIAGDHYTMMREPQVQVLAALVRAYHKPEADATWWRKRPV